MAILKCKMCGGDLNITEGISVCECEYCGTKQTVPTADNEKKMNLFNRATRLRINGEFDKAAALYENLVAEFPEEAEAYWGLVICHYGIEYVDDPATGKRIPTCHRASFDPISGDENYLLALEYAEVVAQKVYRDEAREIDRIREEILSVGKNEKPYDIFICYKETADNGERTIDSVIAQNVYDALTDKGYRVFFSRISLEDKLGSQYEPYIFAALNSAKVMLAFGTKYEYFHAVWVKNEWSRFLKLMAKDKKRVLIPCYKDMDAYDMPDEFHALQAQDMGKVGALQDLLRGIEKIIGSKALAATPTPQTQPQPTSLTQLMLAGDVMYEGEVFANIPHGQGKASYSDGAVYEGQWNRGKRSGHGTYRATNHTYDGLWDNDQKHGLGTLVWAEGGEWSGEFRADKPWNGNGVYLYENGRYEGDFINGIRHGQGAYHWGSGDSYTGAWIDGKRHGQGVMSWSKGGEWSGEFRDDQPWNGNGLWQFTDCYYEGPWQEGVRQGTGLLLWDNGNRFEGEFANNQPWSGQGIILYDNARYEGALANGKRHGQGKMVWDKGGEWNGKFYNDNPWEGTGTWRTDNNYCEGTWANGGRQGLGKIVWDNGNQFEGEFVNNRPWNGTGVCFFDDGHYVGNMVDGKREGHGKYHWNDGDCYEGEWHNDQRHGQGVMTWKKGGQWSGEFYNDNYWNGQGTMFFTDGSAEIVTTKRGEHR